VSREEYIQEARPILTGAAISEAIAASDAAMQKAVRFRLRT
jgi:hypothetical protein